MRRLAASLLDWLDDRAGWRRLAHRALGERLPPGTGWFFTLGSVLLLLLLVQAVTGVVLAFYYAPTPDHAWASLRFVQERVTFGRLVRDLHHFGASFLVVFAVVHLLRVFVFGSYKAPRELTWITGVLLLLVLLALALTGYLLPWDQRAYWATVVTINIARTGPIVGEATAALLRGGAEVGALTLSRWYAMHVIVLPAALVALVAAHLALMRRHGISGPVTPREGEPSAFYPAHAAKDAVAAGAVFAVLVLTAIFADARLEPVADPSDASYVPRPEWYFLWLFELLKYFPGKLEVAAAHGVPLLLVALLLLLPFLDRRRERRPSRRPVAMASAAALLALVGGLTALGLRDVAPPDVEVQVWGAQAIAGRRVAASETCTACHRPGGEAPEWERLRWSRDGAWIQAHAFDPRALVPVVPATVDAIEAQRPRAVAAWARALRRGVPAPALDPEDEAALSLIGTYCLGCHVLDGDGQGDAPNLSRAGRDRDAEWLAGWIANPLAYEYDAEMPGFAGRLSAGEIRSIAAYLAARK
jgi:ubiquinol-cytochrome c reductase cytochrome b subunit